MSTVVPGKLKVLELRAELAARGLDTKGNKVALVERLKTALKAECDELTENEPVTEEENKISDEMEENLLMETDTNQPLKESENDAKNNVSNNTEEGDDDENQDDKEDVNGNLPEDTQMDDYEGGENFDEYDNYEEGDFAGDDYCENNFENDSNFITNSKTDRAKQIPQIGTVKSTPEIKHELKTESSSSGMQELGLSRVENSGSNRIGVKNEPVTVKSEMETSLKDGENKENISKSDEEIILETEIKKPMNIKLDTYNSDLNLVINNINCTATPLTSDGFAFMWAGARSTHGVKSGKVFYEIKVMNHLFSKELGDEVNPYVVRLGYSCDDTSMQLGEEPRSWGYGGTGKASTDCKFFDYGVPFAEGDIVAAFLDMDSDPVKISYAVNGRPTGVAFNINKSTIIDHALFPHILTKNSSISFNFGHTTYSSYIEQFPDFVYLNQVNEEDLVLGSQGPKSASECEMIMMCGLPGSGKSTWAMKHSEENPDKRYNVLGTNNIIDKMRVMGLPRKRNYHGRWDVLIQLSTRCINKLFEIGSKLNRNFILDQTNVYPSAQRRKMKSFSKFKRIAVVLVPTDEEFKRRVEKREQEEGKDVPDSAVLEMKANFALPEVGDIFDEVRFVELPQAEAEALVQQYNEEGRSIVGAPVRRARLSDTPAVFVDQMPDRNRQRSPPAKRLRENSNDSRRRNRSSSRDRNRSRDRSRERSQDNNRSQGRFGRGFGGRNNRQDGRDRGGRGGGGRGGREGLGFGKRGGRDNFGSPMGGWGDQGFRGMDDQRGGFQRGRDDMGGFNRRGSPGNRGGGPGNRGGGPGNRGGGPGNRGGGPGNRGGGNRGFGGGGRGGFQSGNRGGGGGFGNRGGGRGDNDNGGFGGSRRGGSGGFNQGREGFGGMGGGFNQDREGFGNSPNQMSQGNFGGPAGGGQFGFGGNMNKQGSGVGNMMNNRNSFNQGGQGNFGGDQSGFGGFGNNQKGRGGGFGNDQGSGGGGGGFGGNRSGRGSFGNDKNSGRGGFGSNQSGGGGRRSFGADQSGGRGGFGNEKGGRSGFNNVQSGRNSFGSDKNSRSSFGNDQGGRNSFGQNQAGRSNLGNDQSGRNSFGNNQTGQNNFTGNQTGRGGGGNFGSNENRFGSDKTGRNSFGGNSSQSNQSGQNSFGGNSNQSGQNMGSGFGTGNSAVTGDQSSLSSQNTLSYGQATYGTSQTGQQTSSTEGSTWLMAGTMPNLNPSTTTTTTSGQQNQYQQLQQSAQGYAQQTAAAYTAAYNQQLAYNQSYVQGYGQQSGTVTPTANAAMAGTAAVTAAGTGSVQSMTQQAYTTSTQAALLYQQQWQQMQQQTAQQMTPMTAQSYQALTQPAVAGYTTGQMTTSSYQQALQQQQQQQQQPTSVAGYTTMQASYSVPQKFS